MLSKPADCAGCTLQQRGTGFTLPSGPVGARLMFLGESAGKVEVIKGEAFVGPAGGKLNFLCTLADIDRHAARIYNVCQCRPPADKLEGMKWERGAVEHCRRYLDPVLNEPGHEVVVTLGGSALRRVLELPKRKGDNITVQNFHGTVQRDPSDRFWVVPTFHPSHLLRGAAKLSNAVWWDLQVAKEVLAGTYKPDPARLYIDPSVELFRTFVLQLIRAVAAGVPNLIESVDIETPDKQNKLDEGELTTEDVSYKLLRVNFATNEQEGWTVPAEGPYLYLIAVLLWLLVTKSGWNFDYDLRRLWAWRGSMQPDPVILAELRRLKLGEPPLDRFDVRGELFDAMWGWHLLQSDLPRGLGFAAPFYSRHGAWKHLAKVDFPRYAATDGVQNQRVTYGVLRGLRDAGLMEVYWKHFHKNDQYAFRPACDVGLPVNPETLKVFDEKLTKIEGELFTELQQHSPMATRSVEPKDGWAEPPDAEHLAKLNATRVKNDKPLLLAPAFSEKTDRMVRFCRGCAQVVPSVKHRCTDKSKLPDVVLEEQSVVRWYVRTEFNPGSWQQVLKVILSKGHKPDKDVRKEGSPYTTGKKSLEKLQKKTADPFYTKMLLHRDVAKVKGTYVDGSKKRLREDNRLHGVATHAPSTMRISWRDPNLTNVVADKGGREKIAAGFRDCVEAAPGCVLLGIDAAGTEAVQTGWWAGDPVFMRLGKLGVHAYFCGERADVKQPIDLRWSDAEIADHFKMLKKNFFPQYDETKRTVYLTLYGGTPMMMHIQYPETFPNVKAAERMQNFIFERAPLLKQYQNRMRSVADKRHMIGGRLLEHSKDPTLHYQEMMLKVAHPYGYRHWYWEVLSYTPITAARAAARELRKHPVMYFQGKPYAPEHGTDYKRCVAFPPQSSTAGNQRENLYNLFALPDSPNYIGGAFYGRTPLRALIHDEIFLEVPIAVEDRVIERVARVMTAPIVEQPLPEAWGFGPYLQIGISVKRGRDWGHMEEIDVGDIIGVAGDEMIPEDESDPLEQGPAAESAA